jgi:hypothetical protein
MLPTGWRQILKTSINSQILVSITSQNMHASMDRETADRAINISLWGPALLIFGGTILAYFMR